MTDPAGSYHDDLDAAVAWWKAREQVEWERLEAAIDAQMLLEAMSDFTPEHAIQIAHAYRARDWERFGRLLKVKLDDYIEALVYDALEGQTSPMVHEAIEERMP